MSEHGLYVQHLTGSSLLLITFNSLWVCQSGGGQAALLPAWHCCAARDFNTLHTWQGRGQVCQKLGQIFIINNNKSTWPRNAFFPECPSLSPVLHVTNRQKDALILHVSLKRMPVIRKKFNWHKVRSVENCRNGEMISVICKNRQN